MAGPSRCTALLDACVLYPAAIRDALMSLHFAGFYAAKWTTQIEHEWTSNLLKNRDDLSAERLAVTCQKMHRVVRDWQVTGHESLIPGLSLPDPDDRHVLAAAIRGHADCIVTANLDDFPKDYVAGFDLEVIHPDDFLVLQLDLDEVRALKVFKGMRTRLENPAMSPEAFVQNFAHVGLARTAARLAEDLELL
jgi:predicted nucleic acid-binding protein